MHRQLRIRVLGNLGLTTRAIVLVAQQIHQLATPIEQAAQRALRTSGQRVRRQERQRHRGIEVAYHRVRQTIGIDLPPAHRFRRGRTLQTPGVGAGVGDLQEEVVTLLVDA